MAVGLAEIEKYLNNGNSNIDGKNKETFPK